MYLLREIPWAILIGFLHIFVSTGYLASHKIVLKCPFMQTSLALQNHAKSYFPARTQSSEISNFDNIFAISEYLNTPIFSNENRHVS